MKINEQVQIVAATESDCGEILKFIKGLAQYEKLENEVSATEEKLRNSLFGKGKFAEVIFLVANGEKVGFALFFHNYSTFLAQPGIYLEDLFVFPDKRGLGYGKMLFKYLAKLAVERGCGRLEWSVLDWNQPAIDFYLSFGAIPMKEWTGYRLTGKALQEFGEK